MYPEYDELVAKFVEPLLNRRKRIPYVLFGVQRQNFDANGNSALVPDLFCLDCSSSSGQIPTIQYYLKKGYKILKYWFPEDDRPQVINKGEIGVILDEKAGTGLYGAIARFCQDVLDHKKLVEDKTLLEKRLAEEIAKNAEIEGKVSGSAKGCKGKAEGEARV